MAESAHEQANRQLPPTRAAGRDRQREAEVTATRPGSLCRPAVLLPSLLCLCLLGSCSPAGERGEEVVIGVITSYARNIPTLEGARLAAEQVNAAGGLAVEGGSARLVVLFEDNESRPETAVSKALLLINRRRAAAIVGLPQSVNAIPVARVAEQSGVPMITTQSTHPLTTQGRSYVFRMAFLNAVQAEVMARFALEDLGGIRKVAILSSAASEYSADLADAFGRQIEKLGGEVVAAEVFIDDDSRLQVDEQLLAIRDAGAEAIFLPYNSAVARPHMLRARELGIDAVFLGGDTWNTIARSQEPLVSDSYFIDVWSPDQPNELAASFIDRYHQAYGAEPTTSAALAYDAMLMIAEAIRRQRRADPASIRDGLATLTDFSGVTGAVAFDESGDPRRSAVIRRIDEHGKLRLHRNIADAAGPG